MNFPTEKGMECDLYFIQRIENQIDEKHNGLKNINRLLVK